MHHVRWDTLFTIGGHAEDTTLLRARLMAARHGTLHVYDFADSRLKAFDGQGGLRWVFGRDGAGPGEFKNPTHIAVADDGAIWVTDAGAARITILGPDGALRTHIPMDGRPVMRTFPLHSGMRLFTTSEHLWILLNDAGQVVSQSLPPVPEIAAATPSIRAPWVSLTPDGRTWTIAFITATPFLVYDDDQIRCVGHLVEGTREFPAAEVYTRGMPIWAIGTATSRDALYVLARGQTDLERQLLDEYSLSNCTYRRTLRLPRLMQGIAYDDDVFFFYYEDPAPTIVALRPAPER